MYSKHNTSHQIPLDASCCLWHAIHGSKLLLLFLTQLKSLDEVQAVLLCDGLCGLPLERPHSNHLGSNTAGRGT